MVARLGGREGELARRGTGLFHYRVVVVEDFLNGDFDLEVWVLDVVVEGRVVFFGSEVACKGWSVLLGAYFGSSLGLGSGKESLLLTDYQCVLW